MVYLEREHVLPYSTISNLGLRRRDKFKNKIQEHLKRTVYFSGVRFWIENLITGRSHLKYCRYAYNENTLCGTGTILLYCSHFKCGGRKYFLAHFSTYPVTSGNVGSTIRGHGGSCFSTTLPSTKFNYENAYYDTIQYNSSIDVYVYSTIKRRDVLMFELAKKVIRVSKVWDL
jgi:hypothetical protein